MEYDGFWRLLPVAAVLAALAFLATPAMAVGTWTWEAGDPYYSDGAEPIDGTIDVGSQYYIPGNYIGTAPGTYTDSYGSSGDAVGWDDTAIDGIGDAKTNGDTWDGLWVGLSDRYGWWDLGQECSGIVVSASQAGGPYLAQGLAYRVQGCTEAFVDASCSDLDAELMVVYLDGWRQFNPAEDINGNGWSSDDITATFYLTGGYRYARLAEWGQERGLNAPKIDAVGRMLGPQPIPEFPGAFIPAAVITAMVVVVIWLRKRG